MISLEHVSFSYGARGGGRGARGGGRDGAVEALSDLTAHLAPGSFHFLTGPAGAGKTTLMRLLWLELRPARGTLRLFNTDPWAGKAAARVQIRRRTGVILQDARLLDHMTVAENVGLPLRVGGPGKGRTADEVAQLLKWVGLAERAGAHPPELDAGEQQRAALARAVIADPDTVLADEPTGNLDAEAAERLFKLLLELNSLGKTVLVATHDIGLVRAAAVQVPVRVLRLDRGRLVPGPVIV